MQTAEIDGTPGREESLSSPRSNELHAEIRRHLAVVALLKDALSTLREFWEENDVEGDFEAYCGREFGFDAEALFEATDRLKL
jgi:hypothetical protein